MARFVHPHFQKSRDLLRDSYEFATSHHEDLIGNAGAAIQAEIDRHAARRAADAERPAANRLAPPQRTRRGSRDRGPGARLPEGTKAR
jgi:hypothetical protein